MACNNQIPGDEQNLPPNTDYSTPTKRKRLQYMQQEHTKFSDINQIQGGAMPDTLRIGIRMRYFAIAPNLVCENEWLAYTLYHAHDRMLNYWNLLMYFCYDPNSQQRLTAARSVRYYGVPDNTTIPDRISARLQDPNNYCPTNNTNFNIPFNSGSQCGSGSQIQYYPEFIEQFIEELNKLRNDKKLMPDVGEQFSSDFRDRIAPAYENFAHFFVHVYRHHYRQLCGMGILLHFNSFFINIIHQGFSYNLISTDNFPDSSVLDHYHRIIEEEDKRVKGGN